MSVSGNDELAASVGDKCTGEDGSLSKDDCFAIVGRVGLSGLSVLSAPTLLPTSKLALAGLGVATERVSPCGVGKKLNLLVSRS